MRGVTSVWNPLMPSCDQAGTRMVRLTSQARRAEPNGDAKQSDRSRRYATPAAFPVVPGVRIAGRPTTSANPSGVEHFRTSSST